MQHHLGTKSVRRWCLWSKGNGGDFLQRKRSRSGADGSAGSPSTRLGARVAGHIPPFV